ncbi:AraC family transcriptional regulator [Gracilibacillus kekensis]|uniref:Transcriptional regulator, AraC family n=1 Tax=Gracilibacillus kekensis TaxID=1027249 RepID=A0A1M7N5S1_9BACI|nr:AraC family transcriptional regulator [Gracilibacillus kekensis]SHM98799.1 transcriptional regulator, AraC family [Gracilibacillus kekensis]
MEDIVSVEYRVNSDPDHDQLHSHNAYEIYIFHKGRCRYLINNEIYDLMSGDILLMDGLALHKPNIPKDSEYVRSHLHFSPEIIQDMLKSVNAIDLLNVFQSFHHYLIRTQGNSRLLDVENIFKRISEINKVTDISSKEKEWEIKFLMGQLLVTINYLLKDVKCQVAEKSQSKTCHAERIVSYIQHNFHENITITKIANALNLNKSYVSHVFKAMTGFTVMEYVKACRIKKAKYLLETEQHQTIKCIAQQCGFENPTHFSRYFKEKENISPKEYRKKRLQFYKRS